MDRMSLNDKTSCQVTRGRGIEDGFLPAGKVIVEHMDKDGNLIKKYEFPNLVVNQGKNDILDVYFHDATQTASSSWFVGLISNSGYSAIAAGDTAASHSGWTEFTGYSESTRQVWGQGAPASQSITNASPATFSINATGTVKGAFVITNSTKGGTSGKLWAAALFTADVPVNNGDQLKVTYTLSC
jgi:hypothetical protein